MFVRRLCCMLILLCRCVILLCQLTTSYEPVYCNFLSKCRCYIVTPTSKRADCSNLSLMSSPKFTKDVIFVNLRRNNITIFPGNGDLPRQLHTLDLSFNSVSKFQNTSPIGLPFLETLDLQSNHLLLNYDTYFPELFSHLKALRHLNLKNNVGEKSSGQFYPENTFSKLISLEILQIDGIENEQFGKGFMKLHNLRTLNVSGNSGVCSISVLTPEYFKYLPHLETVDFSNCNILRIENGTFRPLTNLTYLDVSRNRDLTLGVFANITYDMQFTSIKILKLNRICHVFGVGTELYVDDMKYLKNTSLEQLHIESNRLEVLETFVPLYAPNSLSVVSLGGNKLGFGFHVLLLNQIKGLKSFNGSNQFTSDDPREIVHEFPNQNSCDKVTRQPCKPLTSSHNLKEKLILDIIESGFKEMVKKNYQDVNFVFPLPLNLETIYYRNSRLTYTIPNLAMSKNNSLRYVDFSGNILFRWEGPVLNLHKLEYLDLSNNYCTYVSVDFFSDMPRLKTLILKDNLFGYGFNEDKNGLTFSQLKQLRHLDLSGNRVQYFHPLIFRGLHKLMILNISRNELRELAFHIENMFFLKYFDVSHNQLMGLPKNLRQGLDRLSASMNVTADLSGNRLLCTCNNMDFLRWLSNTKVRFIYKQHYKCMLKNETVIEMKDLQELVIKMELECSSKIGLIAGVLATILVSVTVIIGGIVHRYRWKIRYLYYTTKNRYLEYNNVPQNVENDEFIYDAFISYADEDRAFVVNDMCKYLEQEGNCKLCIHHRDFLPGLEIASNITNAVHSSRKTVIVLSRHFLKSYWCKFEFNMAHMESIYSRNGRNVVFLIFFDDIRAEDLPLVMMELIETQSYIEYPNDPRGNVVFWNKIKEAILK